MIMRFGGGLEGSAVDFGKPRYIVRSKRPSDLKLNQDEAFIAYWSQPSKVVILRIKMEKELPVIPGMIASVDIKTGEKTVFPIFDQTYNKE